MVRVGTWEGRGEKGKSLGAATLKEVPYQAKAFVGGWTKNAWSRAIRGDRRRKGGGLLQQE